MDNKLKRIVWMIDESVAHSRPADWEKVGILEAQLIQKIGSKQLEHTLPSPIDGLKRIVDQLKDSRFTAVIDLTGWLTPALRELFPETAIVNNFSLSRVRVVSSPKLETTGYTSTMASDERRRLMRELDLGRTLVVDDVTFTGWTSLKTMELWELNPETTTHAFLIANTGMLDPENGVRGAVGELEAAGSHVIWGHELTTPQDDGWHLKDLHQREDIGRAFDLAVEFQKTILSAGENSEAVASFITDEQNLRVLFPERLTSAQVFSLVSDGKFILKNKNSEKLLVNGNIHARNPFLWPSKYFREHIDLASVIANRDDIVSILSELRTLTSDPEAKIEAGLELRNVVRNRLSSVEGNLPGKER